MDGGGRGKYLEKLDEIVSCGLSVVCWGAIMMVSGDMVSPELDKENQGDLR
jgi:hypothetical protein